MVRKGKKTLLCFDNWHLMGPLMVKYSEKIIYDLRIRNKARVETIIRNYRWRWPRDNTQELVETKLGVGVDPNNEEDKVEQKGGSSNNFSVKLARDLIRTKNLKVA